MTILEILTGAAPLRRVLLVPRVPHANSTESTAGDAVPSARDCAAGKGRYFPGFVSLICAYLDFIKCESAAVNG